MRSTSLRRAPSVLAAALPLAAATIHSASAAVPLLFPTSRGVVPFAVAGAFVLPALIAGLFVALSRFGRVLGPTAAICVLVATAIAIVGWAQPGLLASLGAGKAG